MPTIRPDGVRLVKALPGLNLEVPAGGINLPAAANRSMLEDEEK